MIEEAAGTRMYESKKVSAQNTIVKKDTKLSEIDKVRWMLTLYMCSLVVNSYVVNLNLLGAAKLSECITNLPCSYGNLFVIDYW